MTAAMDFLTQRTIEQIAVAIETIAAEELVPRWRMLSADQIRNKGVDDPVTEADLASEARLRAALRGFSADALVLGEEGNDNAEVMARMRAGEPAWIIDPLDGTRPFIRGRPGWGILVAYCIAGRPIAGWMHDPLRGLTACGGPAGASMREITHGRLKTIRPLATDRLPAVNSATIMDDYGETPSTSLARQNARHLGWALGDYEQAGIYTAFELLLARTAFCVCTRMRPWDFLPIAGVLNAAGGCVRPFDHDHYPIDGDGYTALMARNANAAACLMKTLRNPA